MYSSTRRWPPKPHASPKNTWSYSMNRRVRWPLGTPKRRHAHFTASVAESMALNGIRSGAIIISASGMCDAGRIKHHLRHNLPRSECSVLITGFQAKGTLGRRLVDGARRARIFGEDIPVRASIHTVGGLSAHADQAALLAWAAGFRRPPSHTYVVHGEEAAALALAEKLRIDRGWEVTVPRGWSMRIAVIGVQAGCVRTIGPTKRTT